MSPAAPQPGGWKRPLSAVTQAVLARRGVLAAVAVVVVVGAAVEATKRLATPTVAALPQYRVTAASITLSPPPPWVRTDVKLEALRNAGLIGEATGPKLSILDDPQRLEARLATALGFHPWVRSVGRVERLPPNRVSIEVAYRRPLATVRLSGQARSVLIDEQAVRLPDGDLRASELSNLPRIVANDSPQSTPPPRPGEPWNDPRIAGAAAIVAQLGDDWSSLRLLDVTPSRSPEVRQNGRYHVYELRSTGNTRIAWGAAPGFAPSDEPPFSEKLDRLRRYVAANGPLDSLATSPAWIDVRRTLSTRARVVKKRDATQTAAAPSTDAALK